MTAGTTPQNMHELGWSLKCRGVNLIVSTALMAVPGPRIRSRPVGFPEFSRRRQVAERFFDMVGSSLFLLISCPLLVGAAVAVALTSPGSILSTPKSVLACGESIRNVWRIALRPRAS